MDSIVQRAVGSLEPQQVAIGPGLAPRGQLLVIALAQAEGDRQRVSALIRPTSAAIRWQVSSGSSPDWSTTVP